MRKAMCIEVHAQGVVLHVVGRTDVPPVEDAHFVGHRQIGLLLQVLVLHMDELIIVVDIAGIVAGVFGIHAHRPSLVQLILPSGLHKRVAVPQSLAIAPHIVYDCARHASLRVVVV